MSLENKSWIREGGQPVPATSVPSTSPPNIARPKRTTEIGKSMAPQMWAKKISRRQENRGVRIQTWTHEPWSISNPYSNANMQKKTGRVTLDSWSSGWISWSRREARVHWTWTTSSSDGHPTPHPSAAGCAAPTCHQSFLAESPRARSASHSLLRHQMQVRMEAKPGGELAARETPAPPAPPRYLPTRPLPVEIELGTHRWTSSSSRAPSARRGHRRLSERHIERRWDGEKEKIIGGGRRYIPRKRGNHGLLL